MAMAEKPKAVETLLHLYQELGKCPDSPDTISSLVVQIEVHFKQFQMEVDSTDPQQTAQLLQVYSETKRKVSERLVGLNQQLRDIKLHKSVQNDYLDNYPK